MQDQVSDEPTRMAVATAHNQETEPSYGRAERVERSTVTAVTAAGQATRMSRDSNGNGSSSATAHARSNGMAPKQSVAMDLPTAGFSAAAAYNGNGKNSMLGVTSAGSNGNGALKSRAGSAPATAENGAPGSSAAAAPNGKANGAAVGGKGLNRPQGAVWGQGARGQGNPSKGRVDENYETAIRVAAPIRCAGTFPATRCTHSKSRDCSCQLVTQPCWWNCKSLGCEIWGCCMLFACRMPIAGYSTRGGGDADWNWLGAQLAHVTAAAPYHMPCSRWLLLSRPHKTALVKGGAATA